MDNNNVVSAPQLADVAKYYDIWRKSHTGSLRTFIDFMVTPSPERDYFVNSLGPETSFNGSVAVVTLHL